MFFKAISLAAAALFATSALAKPIAETTPANELAARAAADELASRATCTPNGAMILYPQTNYGGSADAVILTIYQGQSYFCNIFNSLGHKPLTVRSYAGADTICQMFTGPACNGSTTPFSGSNANVNFTPGSFFCIYDASK